MCDYSLMMVPNRLAIEGEELVAHRFQSGTTGFVSHSDFVIWHAERHSKSIWQRLRTYFTFTTRPHASRVHSTWSALARRRASGVSGTSV